LFKTAFNIHFEYEYLKYIYLIFLEKAYRGAGKMDYYSTLRKDYICKEMYPNDHRVDYFPKGPFTGSAVKITPKVSQCYTFHNSEHSAAAGVCE